MSIATYKTNTITIAQVHTTIERDGKRYIQTLLTVNGRSQPVLVLRNGVTYEFYVSTGNDSFGLFRTKKGKVTKVELKKKETRLHDIVIEYVAKKTKHLWYGICLPGKDVEYVKYIGNYVVFEEKEHVLDDQDNLYGLIEEKQESEITYNAMNDDLIKTGDTKANGYILDQRGTMISSNSHIKFRPSGFDYLGGDTKWTHILEKLKELEGYVEELMSINPKSESRRNYQTFCKWFLFAIEWESITVGKKTISSEVCICCAKAIQCLIRFCDEIVPAYWIDSILASKDKVRACKRSENLLCKHSFHF